MIDRVGATRIPAFSAENVVAARTAKGWSQGRLAAAMDVSLPSVSAWERGVSAPSPPMFVRLAVALSVDPSELLSIGRHAWTLVEFRVVKGLHQQEVAKIAGISHNKLTAVEAAFERAPGGLFETLSTLYGSSVEEITQAWERTRTHLLESE